MSGLEINVFNKKLIFISAVLILGLSGCIGGKQKPAVPTLPGSISATVPTSLPATATQETAHPTPTSTTPAVTPTPVPTPSPVSRPTSPSGYGYEATPTSTATQASQPTQAASPTATPAEATQPASPTSLPTSQASTCTDLAAYYGDVTIPDDTVVQQGESFVKTWRVRNEGTCTWDSSYALVHHGGEVMSAPLSNPLPAVSPGSIANISVELIAPSRGGATASYWEFQNPQGQRFGVGSGGLGPLWAQIVVAYLNPAPTATPAAGSSSGTSSSCSPTRNPAYESAVLDLINQARASASLGALALSPVLSAAALEHSTDMACNHYVDHTGSDGSTWYSRVAAQGYANYNSARENIYAGHPEFGATPQGAMTWWMNSQVHRDNILFTPVTEIGIGIVTWPGSDWGGYYTVVFARP